jgi:hypothetical protein
MALPKKRSVDGTSTKSLLFASNAIILVVFTLVYWQMESAAPGKHFGPDFDPLYFGIVTHTTIGFGDLAPLTKEARWITSLHAVLTLMATLYFL